MSDEQHTQLLDAAMTAGIGFDDYELARLEGATHAEVMQAHLLGLDMEGYGVARAHGATHLETLEANDAALDLKEYGRCRESGLSHADLIRASGVSVSLPIYARSIRSGLTQDEIVQVLKIGVDLESYAALREGGRSIPRALRVAAFHGTGPHTFTVGLVAAVPDRLANPARARDFYCSSKFQVRRVWAERSCDIWYVLSAQNGLLAPF